MADARATSPGAPGVYLVSDPSSRHHYVGMAEGIQGIRGRIGNQWTEDETVKESSGGGSARTRHAPSQSRHGP